MTDLELLIKKKDELLRERNLCAELYNLWITKLHQYQRDVNKYATYQRMIENLEPYTQELKEEVRIINRKICEIEGVESISDTPYSRECDYKHGYDKPNN